MTPSIKNLQTNWYIIPDTAHGLPDDLLIDLFNRFDSVRCVKIEVKDPGPKYTRILKATDGRRKRKAYGDHAFVGGGIRRDEPLNENERKLMREIAELRKANEILKDALGFFAKDRKK